MDKKVKIVEITKIFNITANTNFNSFNQGTSITFQVNMEEGEEMTLEEDNALFLEVYNRTMNNIKMLSEIDENIATILAGRDVGMEEVRKLIDKNKLKKELNTLKSGEKIIDYSDSVPSKIRKPVKKVMKEE